MVDIKAPWPGFKPWPGYTPPPEFKTEKGRRRYNRKALRRREAQQRCYKAKLDRRTNIPTMPVRDYKTGGIIEPIVQWTPDVSAQFRAPIDKILSKAPLVNFDEHGMERYSRESRDLTISVRNNNDKIVQIGILRVFRIYKDHQPEYVKVCTYMGSRPLLEYDRFNRLNIFPKNPQHAKKLLQLLNRFAKAENN